MSDKTIKRIFPYLASSPSNGVDLDNKKENQKNQKQTTKKKKDNNMTRLCIDFLMVALVMVMVMCILVKAEDERKMFERIERKIEGKEDVFTIDYVPRDWLEDEQFVALIDQPLSESKVIQRSLFFLSFFFFVFSFFFFFSFFLSFFLSFLSG